MLHRPSRGRQQSKSSRPRAMTKLQHLSLCRFALHVFNPAIMIVYNVFTILMPLVYSNHLYEVAVHRDCLTLVIFTPELPMAKYGEPCFVLI